MTGKFLGITIMRKNFPVQLKFRSQKLHLAKTFEFEGDAILQYYTWVTQLKLDDGEKGISPQYHKWRAMTNVDGKQHLTSFDTKEQALAFRKKWVLKEFGILKDNFETRVLSRLQDLTK